MTRDTVLIRGKTRGGCETKNKGESNIVVIGDKVRASGGEDDGRRGNQSVGDVEGNT